MLVNFNKLSKLNHGENNAVKQIRLLCRSAHTYGFNKNKTGFDKHNFRLDELTPEERNYDPELTKNNMIYRQGKIIDKTQLPDLLTLIEADQQNKLKQVKAGMSDKYIGELNLVRSKTKSKLKNWANNAPSPVERDFFNELLSMIGVEKIYAKKALLWRRRLFRIMPQKMVYQVLSLIC